MEHEKAVAEFKELLGRNNRLKKTIPDEISKERQGQKNEELDKQLELFEQNLKGQKEIAEKEFKGGDIYQDAQDVIEKQENALAGFKKDRNDRGGHDGAPSGTQNMDGPTLSRSAGPGKEQASKSKPGYTNYNVQPTHETEHDKWFREQSARDAGAAMLKLEREEREKEIEKQQNEKKEKEQDYGMER